MANIELSVWDAIGAYTEKFISSIGYGDVWLEPVGPTERRKWTLRWTYKIQNQTYNAVFGIPVHLTHLRDDIRFLAEKDADSVREQILIEDDNEKT